METQLQVKLRRLPTFLLKHFIRDAGPSRPTRATKKPNKFECLCIFDADKEVLNIKRKRRASTNCKSDTQFENKLAKKIKRRSRSIAKDSQLNESSDAEVSNKRDKSNNSQSSTKIRFTADNENQCNENESEDRENFMKLSRTLPVAESSPATPILKKKLAEIILPASRKRRRVSWHDPLVASTVEVQKYLEPCGVRASNSAIKRQERLITISDDKEKEETPAAEELNDTDPVSPELDDIRLYYPPELPDSNDPIEKIAGESPSPLTIASLIKELVGKVSTTTMKVLLKHVSQEFVQTPITSDTNTVGEIISELTHLTPPMAASEIKKSQTVASSRNREVQTTEVSKTVVYTQTDAVPTTHRGAQTDMISTEDLITCLKERPDFVDRLADQLGFDTCLSLILNKMTPEYSPKELMGIGLMRFCNELFRKFHDKDIII